MASTDINTVNLRPKRANAGKNPNLDDFSVFGLAKQPTEKTVRTMKMKMNGLYGPNREPSPRKRRALTAIPLPVEETVMVPGGQFGHPNSYYPTKLRNILNESETDSDATTEMSDTVYSASTESDPMEGIEPAEGTFPDDKRKFQCDMCELYYVEEDIHEDRNITDELHLLCQSCFSEYERLQNTRDAYDRRIEKERAMEEIVWPEDAQLFSRHPAHFEMTQPQYPQKSITSAIIDLTISGPFPDSGDFWRYESNSNLIVID